MRRSGIFDSLDEVQSNAPVAVSIQQLAAQHGHRLPAEDTALAVEADAHDATSRRCLVRREFRLAEALGPEGGQAAVSRAGHRVLIHARGRGKEARDKIEA